MLPTPIHRWVPPGLPADVNLWIKRDDVTGMSLSGNKVRKLEFLLADAKAKGADCVVTAGGIQSNHCRATAVAARYLKLNTHLLLRTSCALVDKDPGLTGNLLVERMAGAHIHLITKEEYSQYGSPALLEALAKQLHAQGKKPYVIPVGGSNSLGSWGYLECVDEIRRQLPSLDMPPNFDHIAFACGSGGTAAGLALGASLAAMNTQAKGLGYAISTEEELEFVRHVAETTGIILDPVYSGKALYRLFELIKAEPSKWSGANVLFIHTGGLLGMYDKTLQLQPLVEATGPSVRFNVSGIA
eukprot:jgi/Chlat1/2842/Chrsp194S00204